MSRAANSNDNVAARTMSAVDDSMAATFLAYVAAATIIGADQVALPLRLAQSVAGQLRHQLGGLIDG